MSKEYNMSKEEFYPATELPPTNKQKYQYVMLYLSPLIQQMNCGYSKCEYMLHKITRNEYVKIYYPDSNDGYYVNVSADSLLALTRDVLKTID